MLMKFLFHQLFSIREVLKVQRHENYEKKKKSGK